jgi:hypothetical protein
MCVERHHYLKEKKRREDRGEEDEDEVEDGEIDEREVEIKKGAEKNRNGKEGEDENENDGDATIELARDAMRAVHRYSNSDSNGLKSGSEDSPKHDDKTMAKKKQLAEIEREIEVARMMEEEYVFRSSVLGLNETKYY